MNKILLNSFLLLLSLACRSQSIEEWNAKASENIYAQKYQEAIANYTEIIKINPRDSAVYFDRAFVKHLAKEFKGAIEDFSKAIEMDSTNPDNYYLRGVSKLCVKNFVGAKSDFSNALRIEPGNADVYYFRALSQNELKEYENAILDFNKSIELNSDHSQEALGNMAWANAKLHHYKLAKQNCKKAKAIKSSDETQEKLNFSKHCWCYFHKKSKQIQ